MGTVVYDPLLLAIENLDRVLANDGTAAECELKEAVVKLEQAIRAHATKLGTATESLVDLDRPLLPSPGVARRQAELRNELCRLLLNSREIRQEMQPNGSSNGSASQMESGGDDAMSLWRDASYRERLRQLAADLQAFEREEGSLIQESVMQDVGAGE